MTARDSTSFIGAELGSAFPTLFKGGAAHVTKLAGDISTRAYYRVEGDKSYILQVADPFNDSSEKDLISHTFVSAQRVLSQLGIRVPAIEQIDGPRGWLLLEDLSDQMLQSSLARSFYSEAIEYLVKWSVWARSDNESLNPALRQSAHFKLAFDEEKLSAEMRHTAQHLIQGLCAKDATQFLKATELNTKYLAHRPRFFCHRDYHCRNIMIHSGHAYVIDFQDARMGPLTYDLVSLLDDPYAQLPPKERKHLFGLWRDKILATQGAAYDVVSDEAELEIEYARMKVQRLLKAAGSYASFYKTRGRADYLPCLPFVKNEVVDALRSLVASRGISQSDKASDAELLTFLEHTNFDFKVY